MKETWELGTAELGVVRKIVKLNVPAKNRG